MLRAAIEHTKDRDELAKDSREDLTEYCSGSDDKPGMDEDMRADLMSAGYSKSEIDQLDEEDLQDTDYFISADTVRFLEDNGASDELLDILRATLVEMYGEEILELPEEDEDEEDFDDDDEGDDDEPMELEDEEFEDVEVLGFELTWKD